MSLPPEIRIEELSDRVRYRLPRRQMGSSIGGLVICMFGSLLTVAATAGFVILTRFGKEIPNPALFAALAFTVSVVLLGGFLWIHGTWLVFGHTEIRLRNGLVSSILKIGPLPCFLRHRAMADIERLAVVSDTDKKTAMLVASCSDHLSVELASIYPFDWLWYLGHDMAQQIQNWPENPSRPFEVEAEWTDFTGERTRQPALSRISVEQTEEKTIYRIPTAGWKAVSPLFLIGFLFAIFGIFMLTKFAPFALFGLVPSLIVVLVGVSMARRRVTIEVSPDRLTVTHLGLTRSFWSWTPDEIAAIRAVRELKRLTSADNQGNSSVGWTWVVELQIHPTSGSPEVLTGRYGMHGRAIELEWEWLATELRKTLGVCA